MDRNFQNVFHLTRKTYYIFLHEFLSIKHIKHLCATDSVSCSPTNDENICQKVENLNPRRWFNIMLGFIITITSRAIYFTILLYLLWMKDCLKMGATLMIRCLEMSVVETGLNCYENVNIQFNHDWKLFDQKNFGI